MAYYSGQLRKHLSLMLLFTHLQVFNVCTHANESSVLSPAKSFSFCLFAHTNSEVIAADAPLTGFRQTIDGFSDNVGLHSNQVCARVCFICGTTMRILYENAQ